MAHARQVSPSSTGSDVEAAILDAAEYEGGSAAQVLANENYNLDHYVHRRHDYLAMRARQDNMTIGRAFVQEAQRDGDLVFRSPFDTLYAMEVRAREIAEGIHPLLPLPTTANTETIDSYRTYPELAERYAHEYESDDDAVNGGKDPAATASTNPALTSSFSEIDPASSPTPFPAQPHARNSNQDTGRFEKTSSKPSPIVISSQSISLSPFGSAQDSAIAETPPDGVQDSIASNTRSKTTTKTRGTAHADKTTAGAKTASVPLPTSTSARVEKESSRLSTESQATIGAASEHDLDTQPQPLGRATQGVSALQGRGIQLEVKTAQSIRLAKLGGQARGAASSSIAPGQRQVPIVPEQHNKQKQHGKQKQNPKIVTAGAASPLPDSSQENVVERGTRSAIVVLRIPKPSADGKKNKAIAASDDAPPAKKVRILPPKPAAPEKAPTDAHILDAIVRGTRCARTRKEASEAANARYTQLLTAHRKKHPRARNPDLDAEFFDCANFARPTSTSDDDKDDEKDDDGPVRCLCGARVDDDVEGQQWIACETSGCEVWQHVACMGEPAELGLGKGGGDDDNDDGGGNDDGEGEGEGEGAHYVCHRCDPFLHRKALQKFRRGLSLT